MRKAFLALLLAVAAQAQVVSFVSSPSAAAPAGSTLSTGLIAFWKMDETSGTREDAIGSNDLAASGTGGVGYGTGINGNAADFEVSESDYLSIDDNADLSFSESESFTISFWINRESATTSGIVTKAGNDNGASDAEYYIWIVANTVRFSTSSGTLTSDVNEATALGTGTWYFLTAWYNFGTDSIYIQLNNGTPKRAKATYGPRDSNKIFTVGSFGVEVFFDGLIDDVGVWGRCPTYTNGYAMADSIYAAGAGWRP